jgi:2-polyprenyl-6-methoxyphenol hydroxylase-like FAD-dependent oxidoreductase
MAGIVVLGGGVCGLAAGIMLARDGHEVTVLERDEAPVPESGEEAWGQWSREGVTQFRQGHLMAAGGRAVLEQELPDVLAGFVSAGAARFDALENLPLSVTDRAPRPGDERFVTFTARRPVFEQVLASAAEAQPSLEVRRGVTAQELTMQAGGGTPHVTGVRVDSGEALSADLVVDAMGRRSPLPHWLSDAHIGPMHEQSEDSGFIYYTRYFRSTDGSTPQLYGPALSPLGTFSILTIPSDNDTWSVTVYVSSGDQALKRMRDAEKWTSVIRACPLQAHWLEGEPISDVLAMGGVVDRCRRPSADGHPLLTGIALLGDSCACTNPSLGRGMTLGLLHAQCLRETVGAHLEDPLDFAEAWDAVTEARLMPWYWETVAEDRARLREIEALRNGLEPVPSSEPAAVLMSALIVALRYNADIFRVFLESRCCVTRLGESLARDGMAERIIEVAGENERLALPGPDRNALLALLA